MNLRLAVFASGRGSNFQAILQAINENRLRASVAMLITDKPDAWALQFARHAGIVTEFLTRKNFSHENDYERALLQAVKRSAANFIVLAGYLSKIPLALVQEFRGRMINIHPALLPSFGGKGMYGRRVHQAVLDYGCKVSGATVHLVEEEYDSGPPILQRCVPVLWNDTAESLAARVLEVEHQILPEALQLFAGDRVVIDGRRVRVLPVKNSQ